LRTHPDVAVTIDTDNFPPLVLTMRGRVSLTEVDGLTPEYEEAAHRYLSEAAVPYLEQIDQPVTRMMRIALRPSWVGVLDFQTRLPRIMSTDASQTKELLTE
jgi:hypothetical protein